MEGIFREKETRSGKVVLPKENCSGVSTGFPSFASRESEGFWPSPMGADWDDPDLLSHYIGNF